MKTKTSPAGRQVIAHCLVKNEERFIWYSLNSVLPYVDKIMVRDTGSTDNTVAIIKSISSPKIDFKEIGKVDQNTFTDVRNKMLKDTPKDFTWVMILDGDEIWSTKAIETVVDFAQNHPKFESIVVRTHNLVGDIYHRLPESAGFYQLAGHKGHLNLRLMNRRTIPGLNVSKPHGQQGYFDNEGRLVQDRDSKRIKFLNVYYHHASHLQRSESKKQDSNVMKRAQKYKYEIGEEIAISQIPEVFASPRPQFVPKVTARAPLSFWFIAAVLTPIKRLRRLLLPPQSGY